MKLEAQVCSLELAKKLKEQGVKQESFFEWRALNNDTGEHDVWVTESYHSPVRTIIIASAFTVAELGEILPVDYTTRKSNNDQRWHGINFIEEVRNRNFDRGQYSETDTEADARAQMLIYLLEHKLMELAA